MYQYVIKQHLYSKCLKVNSDMLHKAHRSAFRNWLLSPVYILTGPYTGLIYMMHLHTSSVMEPGVIGCFGSLNIMHPDPDNPANIDPFPTCV